jgi:hypothetical protein
LMGKAREQAGCNMELVHERGREDAHPPRRLSTSSAEVVVRSPSF